MTLDLVQEYRAEQEADALRHSVAVRADVMRDRKQVAQPVSALVPGDIVLLRNGDLVSADGIVLESDNLQLDESILTGEPFPARKNNEWRLAGQCDISTGTVIESNMPRVTPPRIRSCSPE